MAVGVNLNTFKQRTGVLLVNVGTPAQPNTKAVRDYLAQFLTDGRVVSLPTLFRYLLVYGLILPFRSKKSAHAYQSVWDKEKGSPLLFISQSFQQKLQNELGDTFKVVLGMRYGQPSIESAVTDLLKEGVDRILVMPLYPQYASATTGSAFEQVFATIKQQTVIPSVTLLEPFYLNPIYIKAKADIIRPYLQQQWDSVLFSYHGLPFAQVQKAESKGHKACEHNLPCPVINEKNRNCYRAQCYQTTELLAAELGLSEKDYKVSFQSRIGMNRWIGPDTNTALKTFIENGKKNILVVCPSFVTDCLETLEEINIRAKEDWIAMGGDSLTCIPCLNDSTPWVKGVAEMVKGYCE